MVDMFKKTSASGDGGGWREGGRAEWREGGKREGRGGSFLAMKNKIILLQRFNN